MWGPEVDQLLADEQVTSLESAGETLWAMTDNLGSVRDVIDSNGDLRIHRQFDGFGNIVDETHLNTSGTEVTTGQTGYVDEAFAFTGRYFDKDTGLQNNLNRWYDPVVGRWMSEDPIGLGPDANPYRYVGNSPTNWRDPEGFYGWWPPSRWWPWGPPSEGGAGEWANDMLPHAADACIEAAGHAAHMETPGIVGIGAEAAEAATEAAPTVIIKCTTEKKYFDIMSDPRYTQNQKDKAAKEYEDSKKKAHKLHRAE